MFTMSVLGSGSAGNSAVIESEGARVLIDAGMSAKQVVQRLAKLGLNPSQLDGILLTHEHGDHTSSLEVLCRQWPDLAIYCTSATGEALRYTSKTDTLKTHKNWRYFKNRREFSIGDIVIESFDVPHDAVDPVGFLLQNGEASLGFLTDLGHVNTSVLQRLRTVDALAIEANYDIALLMADTHRPWSTKQRIMSHHGHLSNDAAAKVVAKLLTTGTHQLHQVVCGHLSRDCNQPDLVTKTFRETVAATSPSDLKIFCASQSEVSPIFPIARPRAAIALGCEQAATPHETNQLEFNLLS